MKRLNLTTSLIDKALGYYSNLVEGAYGKEKPISTKEIEHELQKMLMEIKEEKEKTPKNDS